MNLKKRMTKEQYKKLMIKSEENTTRNKDNKIVSSKDDVWRKED